MIDPKDYKIDPNFGKYITMEMIRKFHSIFYHECFILWIAGQTCAVAINGDGAIYATDYERWISQGKTDSQNKRWD